MKKKGVASKVIESVQVKDNLKNSIVKELTT
jgi:hypothetical protein